MLCKQSKNDAAYWNLTWNQVTKSWVTTKSLISTFLKYRIYAKSFGDDPFLQELVFRRGTHMPCQLNDADTDNEEKIFWASSWCSVPSRHPCVMPWSHWCRWAHEWEARQSEWFWPMYQQIRHLSRGDRRTIEDEAIKHPHCYEVATQMQLKKRWSSLKS